MPRQRESDTRTGGIITKMDISPDGTVTVNVVTQSILKARGKFRYIKDEVTPNYRKLIAEGRIVMNPVTLKSNTRESEVAPLKFGVHPTWGSRHYIGDMACIWSIPAVKPVWFADDLATAKDLVVTKVYSKVNKASWQSAVSIAEFGKTVNLIAGPFFRFHGLCVNYNRRLTAIKGYKKGKNESSKAYRNRIRNQFSSAWLEFRYGWTPLVMDIVAAQKAYKLFKTTRDKNPRLVARATEEIRYKYSGTSAVVPDPGITTCIREYTHEFVTKVTAGVIYTITDSSRAAEAQRLTGLQFRDIPSIAWELVPYSFVVDWFLNVGNWLEASFPRPGLSVLGSWRTTKEHVYSLNKIGKCTIFVGTAPATTLVAYGGRFIENDLVTVREINVTNPSTPTFENIEFGFQRTLDAITLVSQRLRNLRI